jgi:hypothetical protein
MFNSIKNDGHIQLSGTILSEITALRAFEAGALDYLLMNYFAIGSVLAPERGQKRPGFCDQYTV